MLDATPILGMLFVMAGDMGTNLTRRDALRRGTLLGAGVVWAAPAVRTLTMSSNFAAATSPVVDDEEVEVSPTTAEGTASTTAEETTPPAGGPNATDDDDDTTEVSGIVVSQPGAPQVSSGAPQVSGGQIQVASGQLPLTGIEAGEAALLGAGLLAVGAAIVRATKQAVEPPESE